jgi:hypothetical protein
MDCVLKCPASGCGAKMDLELRVADLLLTPYAESPQYHEVTISENGDSYRVRFRLPTGADQEAAAELADRNLPAAADRLLKRCVAEWFRNGEREPPDSLPPAVSRRLPEILSRLDPQAEIRLDLSCPECRRGFTTVLDTADFFFRELASRSADLFQEIHRLAFHYHWSEAEIMNMTARKRRRYLNLLDVALSGGRNR